MDTPSFLVLPHPPELLLPSDEQSEAVADLKSHLTQLIQQQYQNPVESLVLLQSMGGIYPDALCFHVPEKNLYRTAERSCAFDSELAHHLQKSLLEYEKPHHLLDQPDLVFTADIVLDLFEQAGVQIPHLVVIGVSLQSFKEQYEYGSLFARALRADSAKTAVVACGQLSHTLCKESVAGYVPEARAFDKDFVTHVEKGSLTGLEFTDQITLQEVGQDLFRPFAMGLGVLDAHQYGFQAVDQQYRELDGIGLFSGLVQRKSQS